jgi:hypothetical protein
VLYAQLKIRLPARIGPVHDQVHGVGRRCDIRIRTSKGCQLFIHLDQPVFKAFAGALVQSRETANDALLAAGQRELRPGDQEHGRSDEG